MRLIGIVLAAGNGSRMGRDKLVLPFEESTVLEKAVAPLLACAGLTEVVVVVRPGFAVPRGLGDIRVVVNADPSEGMAASLRVGVAATQADGWLLSLGDLPRLTARTVTQVAARFEAGPEGIVVPTWMGRRGHPVALAARYRDALLATTGDVGARHLLSAHAEDIALLAVDDPGIVRDVDTPADLIDGAAP